MRLAPYTIALLVALHAAAAGAHPQPPRCFPGDPRCSNDRGDLLIAVDRGPPPPPPPPPAPPPPPRAAEVSWTSGEGSMPWSPEVTTGPAALFAPDFFAFGFDIAVGVRHFTTFDPNPSTRGAALAFATLGLGPLPRGALIGNDVGLDLTSRVFWLSGDELILETALRPAFRVQTADARISLPSVLGTLAPAIGFVSMTADEGEPHANVADRYGGLLLRWAFGVRFVVIDSPVLVAVELEPTLDVIVPTDGHGPQVMGGLSLNIGLTPMQN